ncbi:MAG: exodeoxyribonuclease V subunit alpha [Polyangiaceae bacterium]|nr:exodeoxyribonuclease V subunit alpha [Polyangiaceae bacterium]
MSRLQDNPSTGQSWELELTSGDILFAELMGRLHRDMAGEESSVEQLQLAAALVCLELRQGNLCFDLGRRAGKLVCSLQAELLMRLAPQWASSGQWIELTPEGERRPSTGVDTEPTGKSLDFSPEDRLLQLVLPDCGEWQAALEASPVVGSFAVSPMSRGDAALPHQPLLLDPSGFLALYRSASSELDLARRLLRLVDDGRGSSTAFKGAGLVDDASEKEELQIALDKFFPDASPEDRQRRAAELAMHSGLLVVSGGPGTGKTSTVVRILALLFYQALQKGERLPRVVLSAPTGKAAARLTESIAQARKDLVEGGVILADSALDVALELKAQTLHRVLGVHFRSPDEFRYNQANPLDADLLLIDEASMVDQLLMGAAVSALRQGTQLILLGDRFQLSSVSAGSVLAEICSAFSEPSLARAASSAVVVELVKSWRFDAGSGIGALARSIQAGDLYETEQAFESFQEIGWISSTEEPKDLQEVAQVIEEGFRPALQAKTVDAAFESLERFRILTAHRRGAYGVETLNPWVEKVLTKKGLLKAEGAYYRGRVVMIGRNDDRTGLKNGDIGLFWPNESGQLVAYFRSEHGEGLDERPIGLLPEFESAFCTTIHKSQGSEYKNVLVILPPATSQLLSRELLYTAVTRAKSGLNIVGSKESMQLALEKISERSSRLAVRLAELNSDS